MCPISILDALFDLNVYVLVVLMLYTRARSRSGAIANPHAKVSDSPSTPQSHPGHDLGNRMKILFNMFSIFYLWEHTQFGIKIFEINMLMIFDILTSP